MAVMPMQPDRNPSLIKTGAITKPTANRPPITSTPIIRSTTPIPPAGPTGRYSPPVAPPSNVAGAIPEIEAFLGSDTGYQQQLRELALALSNFNADVTRRQGDLTANYGLSTKALEDQKLRDLDLLEDDYGARGLLRSGLYGKAVGDYESEFSKRLADLARQQEQALSTLTSEQTQFGSTQRLNEQAAREAAIRRRAERYGVI